MRVSIAICTWNRAALLDQTLTHLQGLVIPDGVQWELIVVNNGSSDDTEAVLSRHAQHLPLRRCYEPALGLARARNAAIAAMQGELFLWTDDDVLVDRQWLAEYVAAAHTRPEISFFGGTIEPWFESPPPDWILAAWPRLSHCYGERKFEGPAMEVDMVSMPYGANFAVRSEVQRHYHFDPDLGRIGTGLLAGEETGMFQRMLTDGHRGLFLPMARIQHFVPQDRLSLEFLRRAFFGRGATHALEFLRNPDQNRRWLRVLAKIWFRGMALHAELAYRLTRRWSKPARWVWYATQSSYCRGWLSAPSASSGSPPRSPQ